MPNDGGTQQQYTRDKCTGSAAPSERAISFAELWQSQKSKCSISQDLPAPEMVASLNWRQRGPEAARGGLDVSLVISDTTLDWLPTCSLLLHGGLLRPVTPGWVFLKECVTPNTHMSLIYLLEKFNFEVSRKSRVFIKNVMRLN